MRRCLRSFPALAAFVAVGIVAAVVGLSAFAGAQTTPTTQTTTGPGTGTTTTRPSTATTVAPTASDTDDSGSDIPWVPIAIAAAVVLAIVIALIIWSRARRRAIRTAATWRAGAADATAEAGATARMLSGGSPATAAVAQQILASLRAFEDLEASAPDSAARSSAQQGRRVIQNLGRAIDSDYSVRRAQPPAGADRVEGSAAKLRSTAGETDRALRALYRGFTETS